MALSSFYDVYQAAVYGKLEKLEELLKRGEDPNKKGGCDTPLWYAAHNGNIDCVKLLIKYGGDVNIRSRGETTLNASVETDNPELVTLILDAGADIDSGAVVTAAFLNKQKVLALFIARGADLVKGSPLYSAVRFCRFETTTMLLDAGVDINTLNKYGKTPLDAAYQEHREESGKEPAYYKKTKVENFDNMIAFLRNRGGKTSVELTT